MCPPIDAKVLRTMDDPILSQLKSALSMRTPEVFQDSRLTVSLLRDLSGPDANKWEISALAGAVEEDIPATLLRSRDSPVSPTLGDQLVRRLRSNRAIGADEARWAVQTWAAALEVPGVRFLSRGGIPDGHPAFVEAPERSTRLADQAAQIAETMTALPLQPIALATAAAALAGSDAGRSQHLLDQALLAAAAVPASGPQARHDICAAIAATHPEQAEQLALELHGLLRDDALDQLAEIVAPREMDRAQRLAWSIRTESLRMATLTGLAGLLAADEPDRAADLARSLPDRYWKAEALSQTAAALALDQPGQAMALLDEAEKTARPADAATKSPALSAIARVLTSLDTERAASLFDEAAELAHSLPENTARSAALGALAIALAATDLDRALELGHSLADRWHVVSEIVKVLIGYDPARAAQLARSIPLATPSLAELVVALAATRVEDALQLAWTLEPERAQVMALVGIARTLSTIAPDRAVRLLEDAERQIPRLPDQLGQVLALAGLAHAWAGS